MTTYPPLPLPPFRNIGDPKHVNDTNLIVAAIQSLEQRSLGSGGGGGGGNAGVVNVKDYGAMGNGVTDDTVAIQALLDTRNSLFFPEGTYVIEAGLRFTRDGQTLLGSGPLSTILLRAGRTQNVDMIDALDLNGLTISRLKFDANRVGNPGPDVWTTCIHIRNGYRHRIIDVEVTGGNIEGIYLGGVGETMLANITANENGMFRHDASGIHLDGSWECVVSNVIACRNGFHGIILTASNKISLSNCVLDDNGWNGLMHQWGCSFVTASGIQASGNFRGIYFRDWTKDCTVTGAVANGNATSGIVLDNATNIAVDGLVANGNSEYGVDLKEPYDTLFIGHARFSGNLLGETMQNYPEPDSWIRNTDEGGSGSGEGPPGPAGPAGADGAPGVAGPAGPAGSQGVPGNQGPIGPTGASGGQGATGPAGPQGAASTVPGPVGPQGTAGVAGSQGVPGADGAAGPQGPAGAQGDRGDPGTSVVLRGSVPTVGDLPAGASVGDMWLVTATGDAWVWNGAAWDNAGPLQGPVGPAGPQGVPGAQGGVGPAGSQGPAGSTGAAGADSTVAGPAGPTGPTGPTGAPGAASTVPGPTGPQGAKGDTGLQGGQGIAGPEGNQGPAGPEGPTGPEGPANSAVDRGILIATENGVVAGAAAPDQAAAINALFRKAEAEMRDVYFGPGTYMIASSLFLPEHGLSVIGASPWMTTIRMMNTVTGVQSMLIPAVEWTGAASILRNMTIDGNADGVAVGVRHITGLGSGDESPYLDVSNIRVRNCNNIGIRWASSQADAGSLNAVFAANCGIGFALNVETVPVVGCYADRCATGFSVNGPTSLVGCVATRCTTAGISLVTSWGTITGCVTKLCRDGISIVGANHEATISGCDLSDNTQYGVAVACSGAVQTAPPSLVSGCRIKGNAMGGVRLWNANDRLQVAASRISNNGAGVQLHSVTPGSLRTDSGPWQEYVPTISATSGVITTKVGWGKYMRVGNMVTLSVRVQVDAKGTGASTLLASLPFPAAAGDMWHSGAGKEINMTGALLTAWIVGGENVLRLRTFNDGWPAPDWAICYATIVYECAP